MRLKYKVTVYKRQPYIVTKKEKLVLTHVWTKIQTYYCTRRIYAFKLVKIWSQYKQPYFKATVQSCRKEAKKSVKR